MSRAAMVGFAWLAFAVAALVAQIITGSNVVTSAWGGLVIGNIWFAVDWLEHTK